MQQAIFSTGTLAKFPPTTFSRQFEVYPPLKDSAQNRLVSLVDLVNFSRLHPEFHAWRSGGLGMRGRLDHLNFEHSNLFRASDFEFRIFRGLQRCVLSQK
jgi:hypothetical protein